MLKIAEKFHINFCFHYQFIALYGKKNVQSVTFEVNLLCLAEHFTNLSFETKPCIGTEQSECIFLEI